MNNKNRPIDRDILLADIAEMYYREGKTQAEISRKIGITRSAISRMLTEARQKGIVNIQIYHPLRYDKELEKALTSQFDLKSARVVVTNSNESYPELQKRLGRAAAIDFQTILKPNMIIGVAWGTSIYNMIEAYSGEPRINIKVVQLLGVMGATRLSYSGQTLVENLAQKLNGEGVFLYTPFLVTSEETATTLMNDPSIKQAISLAQRSDIALLGIGSTKPEYCSLLQGGHITKDDLKAIADTGAVGDVNGYYFNAQGFPADVEFRKRTIGLSYEDLAKIPVRFAVAGGLEKGPAILGALRCQSVNYLTTDHQTATWLLNHIDKE